MEQLQQFKFHTSGYNGWFIGHMQSSYVCPHEKMDEIYYTCCKGWLVLASKCQNQLILGYEAI